ncbi:uncharacterized protein LOC134721030 isoform X3 [Mytilus trossulus]|uniref:uncharacterized protein LOC134700246 isoform X3 n=1 Tax=Mytilus trossulus TaxID=6551 RepID=UPI0030066383
MSKPSNYLLRSAGLIPEETAEELLVVDLAAEQNIPVRINMPGEEMFNHTYFFSSSRGKCFKEHIRCKEIFVKPGAKLEELANFAYQRLHAVQQPKIVYIMAGIPDICTKTKAPAYEESFYNLEDNDKLLTMKNIFSQTRTKLESINCKVVFVTITTMSFHDWNLHRLKCHKTSKLLYLTQYVDMQNQLNSVLHQLNKFITASNEDNDVVTPFLHTYVHKIMGERHYYSYSKLVDGVHPSAALAEKWRKYLKRIMKINERLLME